jgi:hypothetical protein
MDRHLIQQRVKYLIQEGGLHPGERPASRPLLVRLAVIIVCLEVANLIGDLLILFNRP